MLGQKVTEKMILDINGNMFIYFEKFRGLEK